jgi:hypothetical protein
VLRRIAAPANVLFGIEIGQVGIAADFDSDPDFDFENFTAIWILRLTALDSDQESLG